MRWPRKLICREVIGPAADPYLTRYVFGAFAIHVFHRPDSDENCHDHPRDFWTFPLVDYAEHVFDPETGETTVNVVSRYRWHFRKAEYAHRVLGACRWSFNPGSGALRLLRVNRKIITLVRRGKLRRPWGFWVKRVWVEWREYFRGAA